MNKDFENFANVLNNFRLKIQEMSSTQHERLKAALNEVSEPTLKKKLMIGIGQFHDKMQAFVIELERFLNDYILLGQIGFYNEGKLVQIQKKIHGNHQQFDTLSQEFGQKIRSVKTPILNILKETIALAFHPCFENTKITLNTEWINLQNRQLEEALKRFKKMLDELEAEIQSIAQYDSEIQALYNSFYESESDHHD